MRLTWVQHLAEWPWAVSTTTEVDAGFHQQLGAAKPSSPTVVAAPTRRAALLVLGGVRIGDRLLDVLHGDEADAAVILVHHQQLLDAVLMQQALGLGSARHRHAR